MSTNMLLDGCKPIEDEALAAESSAKVLISAATASAVEAIASRIHQGSERAGLPFIHVRAGDLPAGGASLHATLDQLFESAQGGTVLLNDVDQMPLGAQDQLIAHLDVFELTKSTEASFRVLSGTTVLLFDRVRAGAFSENLYYRLNVLHLHTNGDGHSRGLTRHAAVAD